MFYSFGSCQQFGLGQTDDGFGTGNQHLSIYGLRILIGLGEMFKVGDHGRGHRIQHGDQTFNQCFGFWMLSTHHHPSGDFEVELFQKFQSGGGVLGRRFLGQFRKTLANRLEYK